MTVGSRRVCITCFNEFLGSEDLCGRCAGLMAFLRDGKQQTPPDICPKCGIGFYGRCQCGYESTTKYQIVDDHFDRIERIPSKAAYAQAAARDAAVRRDIRSVPAHLLSEAARNKDDLEAAEAFISSMERQDINLRISWVEGRSLTGYEEARREVEAILQPRLKDLMQQALANIRARAQASYDAIISHKDVSQ